MALAGLEAGAKIENIENNGDGRSSEAATATSGDNPKMMDGSLSTNEARSPEAQRLEQQSPQAAFEAWDPRGLFSRRRSQRGSTSTSTKEERARTLNVAAHNNGGSDSVFSSPVKATSGATSPSSSIASLPDRSSLANSVSSNLLSSSGRAALTASPASFIRQKTPATSPTSAIAIPGASPSHTHDSPYSNTRTRLAPVATNASSATTSATATPLQEAPNDVNSHHIDPSDRNQQSLGRSNAASQLLARSRSRSRSRSPMSYEDNISDSMSGSSILSPAAEFLGSFSQHSRQRSNTGFFSKAGSSTAANKRHSSISDGVPPQQPSPSNATFKSSHIFASFIAPDPDEEGEEIDGYIIERTIGHGSYSTVKQARHLETGELVAVKIVRHAQFEQHGFASASGLGRATDQRGNRENSVHQQSRSSSMVPFPTHAEQTQHRSNAINAQTDAQSAGNGEMFRARACSSPSLPRMPMQPRSSSRHRWYQQENYSGLDGNVSDPDVQFVASGQAEVEPIEGVDFVDQPKSPITDHAMQGESSDDTDDTYNISRADPALQKEVNIWSHLENHPHIVPLLRFVETDFASFIFMPLCYSNLLDYVKQRGQRMSQSPQTGHSQDPGLDNTSQSSSAADLARSASLSSASGIRRNPSLSNPNAANKPQRSASIRIRRPGEVPPEGCGLPFAEVRKIFAQLVSGLLYLHRDARVTHKDIKLENILLDQQGSFRISDFGLAHAEKTMAAGGYVFGGSKKGAKDRRAIARSDGEVQLRDFGTVLATSAPGAEMPSLGEAGSMLLGRDERRDLHSNNRKLQRQAVPANLDLAANFIDPTAGSLQYTSPEQIRSPAAITDASVDIWALGCVLYALITGSLPFDDGFEPRLRVNIMKGDWEMPLVLAASNKQDSPDAFAADKEGIREVLEGCLQTDASTRWTIQQIASSAWLQDAVPSVLAPASPMRGRRVRDTKSKLGSAKESADEQEIRYRSRSRGRPAALRSDSTSSSRPASLRRGPSQDEYNRARRQSPMSSNSRSSRSQSRGRRYGGDSSNSWEIL